MHKWQAFPKPVTIDVLSMGNDEQYGFDNLFHAKCIFEVAIKYYIIHFNKKIFSRNNLVSYEVATRLKIP